MCTITRFSDGLNTAKLSGRLKTVYNPETFHTKPRANLFIHNCAHA
ncbi:hypothetical protein [Neisseria dumasiana]|nr:hypothetical protein [Neisseria dumasiana]UOO84423.1 hypothetical protein LVJ88_12360 [Neisseria dumasiana]